MTITSLLSYRQVAALTGLSRSALFENVKRGTFPAPITIGAKAQRFLRSDIEEYVAARRREAQHADAGRA